MNLLESCAATVSELLARVNSMYLAGLDKVLILELSHASPETRRAVKSRPKGHLFGRYFHARGSSWIELYVDSIVSRYGREMLSKQYSRERALGVFLFHELGHHIAKKIHPSSGEAERVANSWSLRLMTDVFGDDLPIRRE